MFKSKYLAGCMAVAFLIVSCNKKDSYDVKGDPEIKFFTNNINLGDAPANSLSYGIVSIPNVAGSGWVNLSTTIPAAVKFPVLATKPVSENVTIEAELDNSLVAAYNASHNTSYVAFPDGIFNTTGLAAHILKGTTGSSDSISIALNPALLNTLTEKAYMAPIKLTTVSDSKVGQVTSGDSKVTYIIGKLEFRRIKYNALAADALGTLITPRTSWAVSLNPAATLTSGGSIIDGSATSFSRWGTAVNATTPGQVDVDMQTSKNVTGIRLFTSNNTTYIPGRVDVYLSNDGINYDLIGSPVKANLSFATNYNYILFYKPIQARYVRLKITYSTSTNTQNTRITELDVYAN
jgi:hypothetical protein